LTTLTGYQVAEQTLGSDYAVRDYGFLEAEISTPSTR
jgi:hypothetical protein